MEIKPWITVILISLAVMALSLLGAVAKLFHDHPDPMEPITGRDVARYGTAGLLAGIILSLLVYWRQGEVDPLLFGVAGLGGFGAVQFLGLGVEIVRSIIRKLGYTSVDKRPRDGHV